MDKYITAEGEYGLVLFAVREGDDIETKFSSWDGVLLRQIAEMMNNAERLQRIATAAQAHKAAWDDGTNSTMAHDTRQALWAALEGEG